jgi:hypothetical protein
MPAARALPPIRPRATAAAFLPSFVVISSISPVAILPIMTARAFTSAGLRSRFGPSVGLLGASITRVEFRVAETLKGNCDHTLIEQFKLPFSSFLIPRPF